MMLKRVSNIIKRYKSTSTQNSSLILRKWINEESTIAELGLNRPSGKNSFSRELLSEFQDSIKLLQTLSNVRALVLRSHVPGVFSSGADLKERSKMTEGEALHFVTDLRDTFSDFEKLPFPTIAAIEDVAVGGGFELALCCDLRVCSTKARLGLVETKLAILPGAGGTQRLPRIISRAKAKELIYTGRVLGGEEAEMLGLVNSVVEQNEKGDAAYLKAVDLARVIAKNGPVGVQMAKIAIDRGLEVSLEEGLQIEREAYRKVLPTKDRIEGLMAFKEKRDPQYTGN